MATKTKNYKLTKPEGTDLVDVDDLNGNFDVIDTQLKANADAISKKQDALTIDSAPTKNSSNPVSSGGVYEAIRDGQSKLTFDTTPTKDSTNPVTSGGIYDAIKDNQSKLTFDTTPTSGSKNPVTSGGIYTALGKKQNTLVYDTVPRPGSTRPVYSGGVYTALLAKQDDLTGVPVVSSLLPSDYLFLERSGTIYKIRASAVIIPSGDEGDGIQTEDGNSLLTEDGVELLPDMI